MTPRLTPAQRHALKQIAAGEVRWIHELDLRTRRGLEKQGLLKWSREPGRYGRIEAQSKGDTNAE